MIIKVDHVGIVVKDLEKAMDFYVDNLGCKRGKIYDFPEDLQPGIAFRFTFLTVGDDYIELIQPIKGPFLEILEEQGEGTMAELCLEVSDIEKCYDELKERGIILTDMHGKPLIDKKYVKARNKWAYLPRNATFGTWIEFLERGSAET